MVKTLLESAWRGFCVTCVLAVIASIPVALCMAVKQSRDCEARGGYQVRDLGCVDLGKIQRK